MHTPPIVADVLCERIDDFHIDISLTLSSDTAAIRSIEGVRHGFENITLSDDGADGNAVVDTPDLIVWEKDGYRGVREEVSVRWQATVSSPDSNDVTFKPTVNVHGYDPVTIDQQVTLS